MKKIFCLFTLGIFFLTACPGPFVPTNKHSIARIKEKYTCNLQIDNRSSYNLQYKYAPVPTRKDFNDLQFVKRYRNKIENDVIAMGFDSNITFPNPINIWGTISKVAVSKSLFTGIDSGFSFLLFNYPNVNVDGLPARFVLMVEGDSRFYSLVYNCEKKNETSTVVITDETIKRLKAFKEDEFKVGYNGRRDSYGKSVEIQDRLYCFERVDLKKSSLIDYMVYPGYDSTRVFYDRVILTFYFDYAESPEMPKNNKVLILYNDNEDKFYYIKDDASVNPVE